MEDRRLVTVDFEFLVENSLHKVSLEKKGEAFLVKIGESEFLEADIRSITPHTVSILSDGRSHLVHIAQDKDKIYLVCQGQQFILQKPEEGAKAYHREEEKTAEGRLLVKAPMPGKVIKISVAENEKVRRNQTLVIVEAMKMENEIKSSLEGYVKKVFVRAGDLVDSERPLLELEAKI